MKKENLASAKIGAKKRAAKGLGNAGLATVSVMSAFIGWGYLSSLTSSHSGADAAEAKTKSHAAVSSPKAEETERELILDEVKASSKPIRNTSRNSSEENVLLNDPFIQNKWGLEKTHAQKAWEITKGSKDIVIAVIDTGIDVNHRDLADNLWRNPGEMGLDAQGRDKATNGIDDDGNGFVDDVHGWNFVHNDHKLTDNHGHGTHIAGIIGAKGGNNFGISGVAPNVSLMILKYYDPKASNTNNLKNTINAIRYAIKMKAHIINYSGGGTDYSAEEYEAVKEAERAGILFVAAAGNERSNTDESGKHYYPADYELSNIISVTAVNKDEIKVLPSSNYGVRTVDLAAPGENIYSALPNNSFGFMTGTSQATAFVTGVAALVMSHNRDLGAAQVKKYILRTGDEYSTLLSKTGTAKLLNSYKALTTLDSGVGLTGVVASNTSKMGTRAFSSDSNPKSSNASNTSALNNTLDETEEPAEAIAMFGRDFIRALERNALEDSSEVRQR
jgi:thermitase